MLAAAAAMAISQTPAGAQFAPTPQYPASQYPAPQYMCQLAAQSSQQGGAVLTTVFGQQLLQLIYQQTGGTGVYAPLVQLGQIVNIVVGGVNALPNGTFVSCRVFHVNGYSDWQLGYSPYTQRIENSSFLPYWTAAQQMPPQPQPQPASPAPAYSAPPPIQQQTGKPQPPQPPAPTQSEACKKFPNLC